MNFQLHVHLQVRKSNLYDIQEYIHANSNYVDSETVNRLISTAANSPSEKGPSSWYIQL